MNHKTHVTLHNPRKVCIHVTQELMSPTNAVTLDSTQLTDLLHIINNKDSISNTSDVSQDYIRWSGWRSLHKPYRFFRLFQRCLKTRTAFCNVLIFLFIALRFLSNECFRVKRSINIWNSNDSCNKRIYDSVGKFPV